MQNQTINNHQGHWILAKLGKKVLRPGGKELTLKLIDYLKINSNDDVVELAPGLGFTAAITLKKQPRTYTGVELNEEAANILRKKIKHDQANIIVGNATETGLITNTITKVYGEAMLTMQADHIKSEIIKEAYLILKKGGLYGIHELCLHPDTITQETKAEIQKELAKKSQVNTRPLTVAEWSNLLIKEGFKIHQTETSPMHLLELKRMIDDEGFYGTLKIIFNILTHPEERKRALALRDIFRKYEQYLNAVIIVAEKE
jgi:ubiquinone/menaquinone biosynthesis C-methylase UbiE